MIVVANSLRINAPLQIATAARDARNHRHIGICGEAPANYPEIASFLARLGIDSISVNAASLVRTFTTVKEAEKATAGAPLAAE